MKKHNKFRFDELLFKILEIAVLVFAITLVALYGLYFCGFRLNTSPSMPIGIYKTQVTTNLQKGDLVEVCLPAKLAQFGFDRGYIGKGLCENGYAPLIKEILAIPNDYVVMNQSGITVNNIFYDFKQQEYDSKHRELMPRNIDQKIDGYLLIGNNNKDSWDSRYFGVVEPNNINAKMQGILTWGKQR